MIFCYERKKTIFENRKQTAHKVQIGENPTLHLLWYRWRIQIIQTKKVFVKENHTQSNLP